MFLYSCTLSNEEQAARSPGQRVLMVDLRASVADIIAAEAGYRCGMSVSVSADGEETLKIVCLLVSSVRTWDGWAVVIQV